MTSIVFDKTPTDTISDIAVNVTQNSSLACCASWDNSITLYQLINSIGNNTPTPKHMETFKNNTNDAMLCCTFADNDIVVGTASGKIYLIPYGRKEFKTIGSHLGIVSGVAWCPNQKVILTGSSYDYKLNLWDPRDTTKPAKSLDLASKCKFLDVANNKAIIVTSDNKISQYDLEKLDQKPKQLTSKITCPITSLAITPNGNGYVVGGLYGVIEANVKGNNPQLLICHRESQQNSQVNVFASNCVALSDLTPKNVIISGGGNGALEYFNAETLTTTNSQKKITKGGDPVTACKIIPKQQAYIVATGNDWSRGADATGAPKPQMTIRMLSAKEIAG